MLICLLSVLVEFWFFFILVRLVNVLSVLCVLFNVVVVIFSVSKLKVGNLYSVLLICGLFVIRLIECFFGMWILLMVMLFELVFFRFMMC